MRLLEQREGKMESLTKKKKKKVGFLCSLRGKRMGVLRLGATNGQSTSVPSSVMPVIFISTVLDTDSIVKLCFVPWALKQAQRNIR